MNRYSTLRARAAIAGGFAAACLHSAATLGAATAFTYQGRLNDGGAGANGTYEFRFSLFPALTGGNPTAALTTTVPVANGLFTTTLDFGPGIIPGPPYWLELAVRTNGSAAVFKPIVPRQSLNAAPYALHANTAAAFVGTNVLAGRHAGDGSGLTNLNAANLTGVLPPALLESVAPPGVPVVSTLLDDTALKSRGYRLMMTVPAPAWIHGSNLQAPSPRFDHTGIWDGREWIIWGGLLGPGQPSAQGGIYRPDPDQWESITPLNAPAARSGHTAVWTGQRMLVWGGFGSGEFQNTGGRFQPNPQLWQPIATAGAPAGRVGHIAIWTGNRMLVWGGRNSGGLLNDGALYDPVLDQWTALALPNPPPACTGAKATWADDRVLVWGGEGINGPLNTGAQLRFAGGTPSQWVALNPANAPAARSRHAAVWTGQKFLVWGGQRGGEPLADGAAYDTASNSWTPLPAVNAPSGRFDHAALWSGQELLVFGGTGANGDLASGGAYDPATDRWRSLSGAGSPLARTESAAAWTGTEVVLFGGRSEGQALGALERLVPQPTWYFYRKP